MARNYLLIALRSLAKRPLYYLLNMGGLIIGISVCLVIALFVAYETSFDKYHGPKEIFRINYDITMSGNRSISPSVPAFVGPRLKRDIASIDNFARLAYSWSGSTFKVGEKVFNEEGLALVDSSFFEVFNYEVIEGDLHQALNHPSSIVLTESLANKYFQHKSALNEAVLVNEKEYIVSAVIKDVPANSTFSFNALIPFSDPALFSEDIQFDSPNFATFFTLKNGKTAEHLQADIHSWLKNVAQLNEEQLANFNLPIEHLSEIHFNTEVANFQNRLKLTDEKYLSIFSAIALMILIIACINYINMATAKAALRAKEVGLRKSFGAQIQQLVFQFLAESAVLLLPAIISAFITVNLVLPLINNISGKALSMGLFSWPQYFLIGLLLFITLFLLAAFYPAVVLSRFQPVKVLKGKIDYGRNGVGLRKVLVVMQFSISAALIICTLIIVNQLDFMQQKKLGFDKEQTLIINSTHSLKDRLASYQNEISQYNFIKSSAFTWRSPLETVIGNGIRLNESSEQWDIVGGMAGDHNYLETMNINLVSGRNFDPGKISKDTVINEFIVNEYFLKKFGFSEDEVIGKEILFGMVGPGKIVGIMQDFHVASLHKPIEPVVLFNNPNFQSKLLVKFQTHEAEQMLKILESAWTKIYPDKPFSYTFIDEQYQHLYQSEKKISILMYVFASISIIVAALGLFGLSSHTTEQRAKEIGVRRVLGASVGSVLGMLSGQYLKLAVTAFIISVPFTLYLMNTWLQDFAYRITISPVTYISAFAMLAFIALLTVSWQSVKAANSNPADVLKNE